MRNVDHSGSSFPNVVRAWKQRILERFSADIRVGGERGDGVVHSNWCFDSAVFIYNGNAFLGHDARKR